MVAQKQVKPYTFTDKQTDTSYTCIPGTELYPKNNPESFSDGIKPLVFVHGWTESMAGYWWKYDNDIISLATTNSYYVSCVNLNPSNNIKDNALMLRDQLISIKKIYGQFSNPTDTTTTKITLVCHSKGGLDTQGFIHYYTTEAKTLIDKVITLSTPFWGSPLCNLIFDAEKIYIPKLYEMLKNDDSPATRNLTTTFCQQFRNEYDSNYTSTTLLNDIPFFTVSGIGTNGKNAIYYGMAKEFMNYIGPNDDDVDYRSAETPGGNVIAILPYHHTQITMGDKIWKIIEPYISGTMNQNNVLYNRDSKYTFKVTSTDIAKALAASALYTAERTWMFWLFPLIGIFVLYYVIKYIYNKFFATMNTQVGGDIGFVLY